MYVCLTYFIFKDIYVIYTQIHIGIYLVPTPLNHGKYN